MTDEYKEKPFMEELGWRGYVLNRLQERNSVLVSSLILGTVWSLWHLPTFFIRNSYQSSLGIGTPAFWLFFAGIVPLTFVFILCVHLDLQQHKLTGELFALSERADTISIGLWFVAAMAITMIWSARTPARQKEAYS